MAKTTIMVDEIHKCSRCGWSHREVEFMPLTRPMVQDIYIDGLHLLDAEGNVGTPKLQDIIATHWAPCPTNEEPILMCWMHELTEEARSKIAESGYIRG